MTFTSAAQAAVVALLGFGALGAPAAVADVPRPARVAARFAAVVQVTRTAAYLDAGRMQGLVVGSVVTLWRAGTRVGPCTVTEIADHHAACRTGRAVPGDLARLPDVSAIAPARPLPPRTSPEVIARLREAVLLADVPRVPFAGPRAVLPPAMSRASVVVSGTAWAATPDRSTFVERIDFSGRGPVFAGIDAGLRASIERWSPAADRRFRPDDPWQLYVWEAMIRRDLGVGAVTIGRFLPSGTIGQPIIDGVQASRQVGAGTSLAIYAGAAPAAMTTAPNARFPTAALQLVSDQRWGRELNLGESARVGITGSPSGPPHAEAEVSARAGTHRSDLAASLQMGARGGMAGPSLEAVRLDGSSRPWDSLFVSAGYRELRASAGDTPGMEALGSSSRRVDAEVRWTVTPGLWVGVDTAAQRDFTSGLERIEVAPAIGATNLFGGRSGFRAAWREERGWFAARGVDLASWYTPSPAWRVAGTMSLTRWTRAADSGELDVWGSVSASAALARSLWLRASLSANAGAFAAPATSYRAVGGGAIGALALELRR